MSEARAPHRPRKRFGQHFLVDDMVIEGILGLVAAGPGDRILEIGPGPGILTAPLVSSGADVSAVEIDRDLAAALTARFAGAANFTLYNEDVLRFDFDRLASTDRSWKVVGNLPYNISTPLIMRLLEQAASFAELIVMVQREVADRLVAVPGSKAYGRLGIMAQRRATIARCLEIGPDAFEPPPRVDSAVVRLVPRSGDFDANFERHLGEVVRVAFAARRKTLANALRGRLDAAALEAAGVPPRARPEELAVEDFVRLARLTHEGATTT